MEKGAYGKRRIHLSLHKYLNKKNVIRKTCFNKINRLT